MIAEPLRRAAEHIELPDIPTHRMTSLQPPDVTGLARGLDDLPGRVEGFLGRAEHAAGRLEAAVGGAAESAGAAVRDLAPGRRRSRRPERLRLIAGLAVGLGIAGFVAWWVRRLLQARAARTWQARFDDEARLDDEVRLDDEAIERAAGEGMSTAPGAPGTGSGTAVTSEAPTAVPGAGTVPPSPGGSPASVTGDEVAEADVRVASAAGTWPA